MSEPKPPFSQMPQSPEAQRILRERAEMLRRPNDQEDRGGSTPFIKFRLGCSELYGIPHCFVEEVLMAEEITPVPWIPPVVRGLVNRRGELMTVIEPKLFFHVQSRGQSQSQSQSQSIIVVSAAGLTVGILVDRLEGEDRFEPAQLAAAIPSNGASNLEHVLGLCAGTITILDVEALLRDLIKELDSVRASTATTAH